MIIYEISDYITQFIKCVGLGMLFSCIPVIVALPINTFFKISN